MAIVERGPLLDDLVDAGGQIRQGERAARAGAPWCVFPRCRRVRPRAATNAASSRPHTAPWHGPIVAVVYRLRISEERQPSSPCLLEIVETATSSHRQT